MPLPDEKRTVATLQASPAPPPAPPVSAAPAASAPASSTPSAPTVAEHGTAAAVRSAEDSWYDYYRSQFEAGSPVREISGRIEKWVEEKPDPNVLAILDQADSPTERAAMAAALGIDENGGGGKWVPDTQGQLMFMDIEREKDLFGRSKDDAKTLAGTGPAVRSFLDVEGDKTSEITRQANDFNKRASLFSELLADEQQFSMNADNQNIKNATAMQAGLTMPNAGGFYAPLTGDNLLSSIVRPSLPDYLRPDYRLNAAVGLPGPQGFDDPDYGPGGMPMYAKGTNPMPESIPNSRGWWGSPLISSRSTNFRSPQSRGRGGFSANGTSRPVLDPSSGIRPRYLATPCRDAD